MRYSDEMLMAYADGELDAATRAAVEAAAATDPEIARAIAGHKALREKLRGAFPEVLEEPVPERLIRAVRKFTVGNGGSDRAAMVTDLASMRRVSTTTGARWALPHWAALAASLVIGVMAGQFLQRAPIGGQVIVRNGQLIAGGALADALSGQLASEVAHATEIGIGLSFRDKSGAFCRTFTVRPGESFAGLACHEGDAWHLKVLTPVALPAMESGGYRMAGSTLPTAVLQAVDERMTGDPLAADEEARARARGWQP